MAGRDKKKAVKWLLDPDRELGRDELSLRLLEACKRYGIDLSFFSNSFVIFTSRNMYLLRLGEELKEIGERLLNHISKKPEQVSYYGLPLFSLTPLGWKPSTRFLIRYPEIFKRNRVQLEGYEILKEFIEGKAIDYSFAEVDEGWVVAFWQDIPIGVGTYKNGKLKGHVPKNWKKELLSFI